MKKTSKKYTYWSGIPDELRYLCLAQSRFSTKAILGYLLDHMGDCDMFLCKTSPQEIIRQIDVGVEALFPLEFHEEDWRENSDEILRLLTRSEQLLQKVAPADYKSGYWTSDPCRPQNDFIALAQRLNVYFCSLYMFTEEEQALRERLELVLSDTERNVRHMLRDQEADKYAAQDDWAEFHYPGLGIDNWEPMRWLSREFIPNENAQMVLVEYCEKYAMFLYEMKSGMPRSLACAHLHSCAEKRLAALCQQLLDIIWENTEGADAIVPPLLSAKDQLEEMLQRGGERQDSAAASVPLDIRSSPCNPKGGEPPLFHESCAPFTKKLHKLMKEYSSMPVVVPYPCSILDGDLDCYVGYVHDKNGQFREKVIAICNKQKPTFDSQGSAFEELGGDDELPF